jgi:hypothetical protein
MERKIFSVLVLALLVSGLVSATVVVDTFQSYTPGALNTVANPPWTEVANAGYSPAAVIGTDGVNQYLTVKPDAQKTPNLTTDPANTVKLGITTIANANTATTLFVRFRADAATTNTSLGLSVLGTQWTADNFNFGNFQSQIRINSATINSVVTPVFNVRNGTANGFTTNYALTVGQWYNAWTVINNATDMCDYYLTTGLNDATNPANILYSQTGMRFRVTSALDLQALLIISQGSKSLANNNQLSFDNIGITDGRDLTIPEPASMLLLGLGGLVMSYRRKR